MTQLRDRLQESLGPSYVVERELGGGGMSRVFVAEERSLGRRVAVKVLPPETAAAVSVERFKREIAVAARLQHPHIVPLHTAGEMDGVPYYTMPFIDGESLRQRLTHQGEMSVPDAIRILHEIADALAYAHEQGVVHRDIKPENILLTKQHALVADFGVAKALSASTLGDGASAGALSSKGLALGTPAYMAPEQAAADPTGDHRVDIYALGCVAYEMLTGHPLFLGRTIQGVLAAHVTEMPEHITKRRPNLPPALAALVMRCLEKRPADRPRSAGDVEQSLASLTSGAIGTSAPTGVKDRRAKQVSLRITASAAAAAGVVAVWFYVQRPSTPVQSDDNVIAVAPFRVSADASLSYLREGMVDLLAANLNGEGGVRASDPRAVLALWRRSAMNGDDVPEDKARELAQRLGAGRVLLGSVVASGQNIVIAARLVGTSSRHDVRGEGSPDSLPQLVDGVTAQILTALRGNRTMESGSLSKVPLPALRAYLDAQAAFRRGHYDDATSLYLRALQIDTTFVQAVLAGALAANWANRVAEMEPHLRRFWGMRDRLSARDRAVLSALSLRFRRREMATAGFAAVLAGWDTASQLAPDNADIWHDLADETFHGGSFFMPPAEARQRAVQAFNRVLALDSTYASAYEHIVDAAVLDGDTSLARRAAAKYLALDSLADHADYIRWRLAHAVGDSTAIRAIKTRIPTMSYANALRIAGIAMIEGIDAEDARAAAAVMEARATRRTDRWTAGAQHVNMLMNQGQPTRAREYVRRNPNLGPIPPDLTPPIVDLYESLYGDVDSLDAARGARELQAWLQTNSVASRGVGGYGTACILAQWYLANTDFANADRMIATLRATSSAAIASGDAGINAGREPLCLVLAESWLAVQRKQPDARRRLLHADSLIMGAGEIGGDEGPIVVSRLWETIGDEPRALTALRHRYYHYRASSYAAAYIAREEGRLAALAGDREGAIRSYRIYLGNRRDPEPRLKPEVDRIKRELARLQKEGVGK